MIRSSDDFEPGQKFGSGHLSVEVTRIKSFAAEFDPQPFHLDEATRSDTFFKGLAANGWHTAAMTMRLLAQSELKPAGGIIGAGFDEMRWPRPLRPGDELHVEIEVLDVRPSKSRPDQGLIKVRTTTLNQNGEAGAGVRRQSARAPPFRLLRRSTWASSKARWRSSPAAQRHRSGHGQALRRGRRVRVHHRTPEGRARRGCQIHRVQCDRHPGRSCPASPTSIGCSPRSRRDKGQPRRGVRQRRRR